MAPIRLLDGLSWRLVALTVLVALPILLASAIDLALDPSRDWGRTLYWALATVVDGLLVLLSGVVLSNLRRPALPTAALLALAVAIGSALGAVLSELPWALGYLPPREEPATGSFVGDVLWRARRTALPWAFVAAAWYFVQRIAARTATLRDAELARHQLAARTVEARLQVMRAQTEPHFLFNTLAHVKRLYRTDPALGRRMLDHFCDYLRAALPQLRGGGATLGQEVELACAYLDVQKIRMGERLALRVDVPADVRALPFPSMLLLSLVENAVKHGIGPMPDGGEIAIAARADDRMLRVSVADSGRGFATTRGTGVGLSNIRAQLSALYGGAASLALTPNSPRGIVASIALPVGSDRGEPAAAAACGENVERARVPRVVPT